MIFITGQSIGDYYWQCLWARHGLQNPPPSSARQLEAPQLLDTNQACQNRAS